MRNSRNYDELEWAWQQWREQSGKKMREVYSRFVELSNEAARMNSNFSSYLNILPLLIRIIRRFQRHGSYVDALL